MPTVDKKYYHNIDLARNELKAGRIYNLTNTQRLALASSLNANDKGYIVYDTNLLGLYIWNSTEWITVGTLTNVSAGTGMSFTTITGDGSVAIDTTKIPYYSGGFSPGLAKWNGSAWVFDNNTYLTSAVTSVSATSPITSSGGNTPTISTSMATNKLIGRSSAGTGVMEEISVGTGLSLSSGTLSSNVTGIFKGTASGIDTYTTTIIGVNAYNDGDAYLIRFTSGNTTGATLNIYNGTSFLGAKTLYRNNDGPLIGGDIFNGGEMFCIYNSTLNGFQCIGSSPNSLFAYVTNGETSTISRGQVVYAYGGTGDRMVVKLASNSGDATSAKTVGVVYSTTIGANQKGIILMQGLMDGLSLFPISAPNNWQDGDSVYLGATAGSITKTKPSAPNHLVYVATVTTASNGNAGRMYVKIQNGYELDEIHDVDLKSKVPVTGDSLVREGDLWKAKNLDYLMIAYSIALG